MEQGHETLWRAEDCRMVLIQVCHVCGVNEMLHFSSSQRRFLESQRWHAKKKKIFHVQVNLEILGVKA